MVESRRKILFPNVTDEEWNDWHWQVKNRIETLEDLKKYIELTPEEEEGVKACLGTLRMAPTPYYLSLIQPGDPHDPVRLQAIPTAKELHQSCADLLEGYGGHALAAGFTIQEENIPAFRARMEEIVRQDTGGEEMVSTLQIDGEIENTALLTVEEVEALSMLEPYGAGNPKPVFSLSGVTITCMSDVGGGRHLKMRASRDGRTVDMIFFSVTRAKSGLTVGDRADVAFYPQINEYRGSRSVQLHLVDLRPAYSAQQLNEQALYRKYSRGEPLSPCEARMMIPQREEFAAVWRYLANRDGEVVEVPASLARKVAQEGDLWESTLHTMICLEVLESFDLVTLRPEEGGALRIRLQKRRGKGKVALYQAPIIQKLQAIAWGEERRSHLSS